MILKRFVDPGRFVAERCDPRLIDVARWNDGGRGDPRPDGRDTKRRRPILLGIIALRRRLRLGATRRRAARNACCDDREMRPGPDGDGLNRGRFRLSGVRSLCDHGGGVDGGSFGDVVVDQVLHDAIARASGPPAHHNCDQRAAVAVH